MKTALTKIAAILITANMMGCNKASDSSATDTSTSGVAASTVGGALSSSSSAGTQARMNYKKSNFLTALVPEAVASGSCPTFKSTGSNCTASASAMWLNYAGCSFTGSVEWTGVQQLSMSSGTAACGTFPSVPSGFLYRQFVSAVSSNTPSSMALAAGAATATIDNSTSNLGNYDGATIATIVNGGYGSAVGFNASGGRTSLTVGEHIKLDGVYDHSITGSLTISNDANSQRQVDGSLVTYHNLLKVKATSTFKSVIHNDMCCWPVEGTISTAYSAGANVSPTVLGAKLVGKSETLAFTGACGSATLTDTDGNSSTVSFSRCF